MTDIDIIIRIGLAVLIGGIIGYERETHRRAAGLRTHILVCVGSTLITLTSIYMAKAYSSALFPSDPTRIAAGIVTGIGFLGAGTIMRAQGAVSGLTTAASLWCIAAIGIALGCGFYVAAIASAVAIFLVLMVLGRFTRTYLGKSEGDNGEEEGLKKEGSI